MTPNALLPTVADRHDEQIPPTVEDRPLARRSLRRLHPEHGPDLDGHGVAEPVIEKGPGLAAVSPSKLILALESRPQDRFVALFQQ